jgi:hypothetical protein
MCDKYSGRNDGVVGMHSDTMAAKSRWMSCRVLIGWLDGQSGPTRVKAPQTVLYDQEGLVTMLRSANSPTQIEY